MQGKLFEKLGSLAKKAVVITEGVVSYLSNDNAAALSEDIYTIPSFQFWIQNYGRGNMRNNRRTKKLADSLKDTTPFLFDVKEPLEFFARQGWKVKENIYILDEAVRLGRSMPWAMFPGTYLLKYFRL